MLNALIARLRRFLGLPDHLVAPLTARVSELESRVAVLMEDHDSALERDLRWNELNAQLRRYLGRLDAHAQHSREREEAGRNGLHARADVIAMKYPGGLPTKE